MELSKKMQDALNEQIREELASAYIYLSMAAYCESINLTGFAHWMQAQSNEEMEHAMKFYGYVNERGGRVVLQALERTEFVQKEAAKLLNVSSRVLNYKIKQFGITHPKWSQNR